MEKSFSYLGDEFIEEVALEGVHFISHICFPLSSLELLVAQVSLYCGYYGYQAWNNNEDDIFKKCNEQLIYKRSVKVFGGKFIKEFIGVSGFGYKTLHSAFKASDKLIFNNDLKKFSGSFVVEFFNSYNPYPGNPEYVFGEEDGYYSKIKSFTIDTFAEEVGASLGVPKVVNYLGNKLHDWYCSETDDYLSDDIGWFSSWYCSNINDV